MPLHAKKGPPTTNIIFQAFFAALTNLEVLSTIVNEDVEEDVDRGLI